MIGGTSATQAATKMSARDEILRRIRVANETTSAAEQVREAWKAIPRNYQRAGTLRRDALLRLFEERLRDYDSTVITIEPQDLATQIVQRLRARSKCRIAIPVGIPRAWLLDPSLFVSEAELTPTLLDECDGVLTASTLAIAETGTVILQSVPGQGRRATSLVPDYHLCVVRGEDVVETVPEAFTLLKGSTHLATTFISGPSATADIEMTRIQGVHGPRTLDVILLNEAIPTIA